MPRTQPPASHPVESSDKRLDEALEETFPASDPIAVDPTEPAKSAQPPGDRIGKRLKAKRPSSPG